jgi:type IV secretion system protein TrbL
MGWIAFFENFIQIACLLFAWALVILAFFILAIQLFVTLIEFKLTTLAGFVLIPFGLFGKTAFMAERVLGNVISSRHQGAGARRHHRHRLDAVQQFTQGFGGADPDIDDAMAIVLAALSLLGLGIFGPGIANGLVSGGPQLGAGAAVGTGLAVGGAACRRRCAAACRKGGAPPLRRRAAVRGGATAAGAHPPPIASARSASPARRASPPAWAASRAPQAAAAASPLKRARRAPSVKSSFSDGAKGRLRRDRRLLDHGNGRRRQRRDAHRRSGRRHRARLGAAHEALQP